MKRRVWLASLVDDLTVPGDDEQGVEEALVDDLGPARLALDHDVGVVLPGQRGEPVRLRPGDVDEQVARRDGTAARKARRQNATPCG